MFTDYPEQKTYTTHLNYAEHHLNLRLMLKEYYKLMLAGDLVNAERISWRIQDEARLLSTVTVQSMRAAMVNQNNSGT
jgi:hypothetical protein